MLRQRYIYPAVFDYSEGSISVTFPDLPGCITCGDNESEALQMAAEALGLHLYGMETDKEPIPVPTKKEEVVTQPHQKVFLIEVYMPSVREKVVHHSNELEKKILTWIMNHFDLNKARVTNEYTDSPFYKLVHDEGGRKWRVCLDEDDEVKCYFPIDHLLASFLGFPSYTVFNSNIGHHWIYRSLQLSEDRWLVWDIQEYEVLFFDSKEEVDEFVGKRLEEEFGNEDDY